MGAFAALVFFYMLMGRPFSILLQCFDFDSTEVEVPKRHKVFWFRFLSLHLHKDMCFFIFPCWFYKEFITTGNMFFFFFSGANNNKWKLGRCIGSCTRTTSATSWRGRWGTWACCIASRGTWTKLSRSWRNSTRRFFRCVLDVSNKAPFAGGRNASIFSICSTFL